MIHCQLRVLHPLPLHAAARVGKVKRPCASSSVGHVVSQVIFDPEVIHFPIPTSIKTFFKDHILSFFTILVVLLVTLQVIIQIPSTATADVCIFIVTQLVIHIQIALFALHGSDEEAFLCWKHGPIIHDTRRLWDGQRLPGLCLRQLFFQLCGNGVLLALLFFLSVCLGRLQGLLQGLQELFSLLRHVMGLRDLVRQRILARLLQDLDACLYIPQEEGVLEPGVQIVTLHGIVQVLAHLLLVPRQQVQEKQLVNVIGHLVGQLAQLHVSVLHGHVCEGVPALFVLQFHGCLFRHSEVSTLDGKIESDEVVLDEVHCNLWELLLLQVGHQGLAIDGGLLDNAQHLMVLLLRKRHLEAILCGVNHHLLHLGFSVQVVNDVALHLDNVNWILQCLDGSSIPCWETILQVVESRVEQDAVLIEPSTLDTAVLVQGAQAFQLPVGTHNCMLGK
mmetsp:Transcript_148001/g.258644  ORF Transcript_148001/g.258644 Transcript_148001/m.258644 type:complete len:448 (-) Transcript_148001:1600-2943(-)